MEAAMCRAYPNEISEGGIVTLETAPPDARQRYRYVWQVDGLTLVEKDEEPLAYWNTTGQYLGSHRIRITIYEIGSSSPPQTPPTPVAEGEIVFNVTPRPVSSRDVQSLVEEAKNFANTLNRVVGGVDHVANRVKELTDHLPGGGQPVTVSLQRTAKPVTGDLPLWIIIRQTTEAMSFANYNRFMELLLCGVGAGTTSPPQVDPEFDRLRQKMGPEFERLRQRRFLPYNDADAYRLLKVATEAFLMVACGVTLSEPAFTQEDVDDLVSNMSLTGQPLNLDRINELWRNYLEKINGGPDLTIPYLALVRQNIREAGLKNSIFARDDPNSDLLQDCVGILARKLTNPCLVELIWSYWNEEGMLVQTLNAITRRFQNMRAPGQRDPLAMLEIDPLRPVNNLLWGYLQDEQHRLSVRRRAYEYDHEYGLRLYGKAVPTLRSADSRSKFLEGFHTLLYLCSVFFKEEDDTTVIADGFPVLNAVKDVHLLLTEGAHNQFGDLPSTARQEMLIQQWLLARPEFREFLPTRVMVAHPEPWMGRVDAMKTLQGWTDVSVMHFRNLAVFGERILLSIRYGAWSDVNDPAQAANWARFWRAEIQGYLHAYRAVTAVDLTADIAETTPAADRYALPSVHLRKRLALQQRRAVR